LRQGFGCVHGGREGREGVVEGYGVLDDGNGAVGGGVVGVESLCWCGDGDECAAEELLIHWGEGALPFADGGACVSSVVGGSNGVEEDPLGMAFIRGGEGESGVIGDEGDPRGGSDACDPVTWEMEGDEDEGGGCNSKALECLLGEGTRGDAGEGDDGYVGVEAPEGEEGEEVDNEVVVEVFAWVSEPAELFAGEDGAAPAVAAVDCC
jgi:hypothetical protein